MWKALIPFLLQVSQTVFGESTYECGDHGRFEYCIDEIPGCVIGCHCHPGFYFDTDTKICEPNSRLHQRRDNDNKRARVQVIDVTPTTVYDFEPTSSTNMIDEHVDEITKDANDLGDWLYNQFFKTIENQVINNTNDKDILTRRSGPQKLTQKPGITKNWRKRGKSSKQKRKKGQLRRKLLRITENDSLFDFSSKSNSDSSDSSSSSDLSSMEYEVEECNHHKHDDEHGHKKIVMINKKPKQPLPSFIFLPNLDTPFYPPIGLPPAPIVPMYPMVPVPPVPLCPISGCVENVDKNHVATTSTSSTTTTPTPTVVDSTDTTVVGTSITNIKTTPTIIIEQSSLPDTTAVTALTIDDNTTTDVPKTDTKTLRKKNKRKKKKSARLLNNNGKDPKDEGSNSLKNINRQKILQRLKEKMNNPSANLFMPSWKKNKKILDNKIFNQNSNAEIPGVDEFLGNEINAEEAQEDNMIPDNVDFKYISELIHRGDPNNNSINLPPIEYNPADSIEFYQSPNIQGNQFIDYSAPFGTSDGRRKNRSKNLNPDETYYANLGRQIAKMIRSMNTKENIEFKDTPFKINKDKYLREREASFWERYVRSPLAYLNAKNKNYEYLKRSNELLFDIENKVEIIASTAPALSLQEIENIVKVMQAAKREIERENIPVIRHSKISSKNLNIDLWPQKSHNLRNRYKNTAVPNKVKQEKNLNSYETVDSKSILHNNLPAIHIHSIQKFEAWNNRNLKEINQTQNIPTSTKSSIKNDYLNSYSVLSNYNLDPQNKIQMPTRSRPLSQNTLTKTFRNHQQINSKLLRQRKYFQDTYNSYYVSNHQELSHLPPVVSIAVHPTYFPEINQFDYAV